jgi:hypothetical protein
MAHFYRFFIFGWRNRVSAPLAKKSIFRVFEFSWTIRDWIWRTLVRLWLLKYVLGTYCLVRLAQGRGRARCAKCIFDIELLFVKFLLLDFVPFCVVFLLFRVRVGHNLFYQIFNSWSLNLLWWQVFVMVSINAVNCSRYLLLESLFERSASRNAYSELWMVNVPENFYIVVKTPVTSFKEILNDDHLLFNSNPNSSWPVVIWVHTQSPAASELIDLRWNATSSFFLTISARQVH